jgi:LmbE family N-acetylglucosaminyl deacetylase
MHPRRAHLLPLAALLATTVYAQTVATDQPPAAPAPRIEAVPLPENRGAAALYESLKRLDTTASLMMIVGHPDDEDGGMLTYESRGFGVRTALFTLTRGEGGQNAMSAADYDALGLIRTNELLRADQYYGVDQQYWGSVADYGFSKTIEEALEQWGHDRVLYDAVRAVRMYRPMVVCSVFVGGVTDGHGHHQVAGMLAQEVFNAAGDPKMFPDQIAAGLQPWQPLKVYERVPGFSLSPKGMFDYATGKYAPVRFHDYVNGTDIDGIPATNVTI